MKFLTAFIYILLLVTPGFISVTHAESNSGFTVVGGAAINFKNSSFDVGGKKLDPRFITLDISGALAYDKYYIAFNYDPTLKDHLELDTDSNGGGGQENTFLNMSRLDYSTVVGMNVWETVNIFAGWKFGETAVNSFSDVRLIENARFQEANQEFYFREQGPFVGASYAYKYKNKGSLSFSLAYARMAGEIELKSLAQSTSFDGTTTGLSYGLEWSGPLTASMVYRLGYKTHRYRFKQDELTAAEISAGEEDLSSDVIFNMLYLGIANFF